MSRIRQWGLGQAPPRATPPASVPGLTGVPVLAGSGLLARDRSETATPLPNAPRRYAHRNMPPPDPTQLVLFDIDGTLLDTQDAGIVAYARAAQAVFGTTFEFEGVPVHGRLDHENYADAVRRHLTDVDHRDHESVFRTRYAMELETIARDAGGFHPCLGITQCLDAIAGRPEVELGLLTGNWAETGRLKIRHAGIDSNRFRCNAFADDGAHRDDLVPVARRAFVAAHGRPPARILVVGDTPRDVACAHAGDAIAIAVATGVHTVDELAAAGADVVVADLTPTPALLHAMFGDTDSPSSR